MVAVTLLVGVVLPSEDALGESSRNGAAGPVYVVGVDGPIDEINRRFLQDRLEAAASHGAQLVLIQIDSPGFLGIEWDDARDLVDRVRYSRVPVVVWLGPAGAGVERGAFWIYLAGHLRGASPLSRAGEALPSGMRPPSEQTLIETEQEFFRASFPQTPEAALDQALEAEELTATGLADFVAPTLGDAIVGIDGLSVTVSSPAGETFAKTLHTADVVTPTVGPPLREPSVPIVFFRLGFAQRILHSAAAPSVAYMLVMVAIVLFALEFYTAGIGIVALSGAACLLIGGYGLGVAGPNPTTLAALAASVPLFAADVQRGVRSAATLGGVASTALALGAASLQGPPQLRVPLWVSVVLGVLYVAAWRLGVVVIVRTRFWAPVAAREKLIGARGTVRDPLTPEGIVVIDNGRFPARSTEGRLIRGEEVVVSGISGWKLVVERAADRRGEE